MVDGDGRILQQLSDDWPGWTFGRTYRGGQPHWWMATRRRKLSMLEMYRGLSASLIWDTPALMRESLKAQAALEASMATEPAPVVDPKPAWNPACL